MRRSRQEETESALTLLFFFFCGEGQEEASILLRIRVQKFLELRCRYACDCFAASLLARLMARETLVPCACSCDTVVLLCLRPPPALRSL